MYICIGMSVCGQTQIRRAAGPWRVRSLETCRGRDLFVAPSTQQWTSGSQSTHVDDGRGHRTGTGESSYGDGQLAAHAYDCWRSS